jgi:hypothetical protein
VQHANVKNLIHRHGKQGLGPILAPGSTLADGATFRVPQRIELTRIAEGLIPLLKLPPSAEPEDKA